jgi:ribosomal protein S18 acetylase RimI-like enzyme
MKTISIRRAVPEDAAVLEPIIREAMTKYREDSGIDGVLDALRETSADVESHIRQDTVLIAFHLGQAVGTVRISALSPDTAEISRFAVLPSAQKTGVGSKLYADAEDRIRRQGYRSVSLHTALNNHHTVRFYIGKGFVHTETSTDRGYPRGLFVKTLLP